MPSRQAILETIRSQPVPEIIHPGEFEQGIVYDDPTSQFREVLGGIGGRIELTSSTDDANEILKSVPEYANGKTVVSVVEGVGYSTVDLDSINDPHNLQDVDFAILPGEWAVAENGAIWVTTPDVCVRTLYFLTQHLAIVVPRANVISNMHEAYERVDVTRHAFGTWLSGPSKTADIEQSLVKGAHGSRTLIVFLMDFSSE